MIETNNELLLPQPQQPTSAGNYRVSSSASQEKETTKRFGKLEREYVFEVAKKLVLQQPEISHQEVVERTINQYKAEYPVERHFMCTFDKVSEILTNGAKAKNKKRKYSSQKHLVSPYAATAGNDTAAALDASLSGFPDSMLEEGEGDDNNDIDNVITPLPPSSSSSSNNAKANKKSRPGIHNPEMIAGGVTGVHSSIQRRLGGMKKSLQQLSVTKDVLVNLRSGGRSLLPTVGEEEEVSCDLNEEEAEFRYATKTFIAAIEKRRKVKPFLVHDPNKISSLVYLSRDERGQDELILHNLHHHPVIAQVMQAMLYNPTMMMTANGEKEEVQGNYNVGGASSSRKRKKRNSSMIAPPVTKIISTSDNNS